MNRNARGTGFGGPSKATPSTLCQKCLKKGHYSYECKAVAQERPYVSRPSRTQQFFDPKLVPQLTSAVPQELTRKKGIADEQLANLKERGRRRSPQSDEDVAAKKIRRRDDSISSASISTISTCSSRSQSPPPRHKANSSRKMTNKLSSKQEHMSQSKGNLSRTTELSFDQVDQERKRRQELHSSDNPASSPKNRFSMQTEAQHNKDAVNPSAKGRRDEIERPVEKPGYGLIDNQGREEDNVRERNGQKKDPHNSRELSLSPFSKRLALTQAMNAERQNRSS
ncbi:BgTH12-00587 [Blumeria graminis f. sp. triticale]|uniref:Zinc knuckle-domain-containing protein n=4 Tax=Blumeria graminis TaxID=34373 RepID=A0A656KEF7_BLUGR|nr:hypothetical protein BGT96224_2101 [Blumeria graminis f. sp. tritici 96224]CAD6505089.1 BgTH12-00587 [Blumeria graminis f. sp. triticale]VDB93092.1 Bgt-2101 [Blumeria graminis f. sp. tritici]